MDSAPPCHRSTIDTAIGFIVPLGVFLEIGSPILLATSSLTDDGVFLPLSLVILPLALTLYLFRERKERVYPKFFITISSIFIGYALIISLISTAFRDSQALIYGMQWAMIFAWFPYFGTLTTQERFISFLRGFAWGVMANLLYYLASGLLEIALYGGLQDAGRLSQNLVLAGQYQILIYVPTLIAYSVALLIVLQDSGIIYLRKSVLIFIATSSIAVLLFLASREAILVALAFGLSYLFMKGGVYRFAGILGFSSVILLFLSLGSFDEALRETDFRLFNKLASLSNEDSRLGGRDDMIADVSQIIETSPIFGSYFLPPNSGVLSLKIHAPSAHNMYVDAFVWAGLLGGITFLLFCLHALYIALSRVRPSSSAINDKLGRNTGLLIAIFLIVSNNINVPMRAPLISPIFSLLVFICVFWRTETKSKA